MYTCKIIIGVGTWWGGQPGGMCLPNIFGFILLLNLKKIKNALMKMNNDNKFNVLPNGRIVPIYTYHYYIFGLQIYYSK